MNGRPGDQGCPGSASKSQFQFKIFILNRVPQINLTKQSLMSTKRQTFFYTIRKNLKQNILLTDNV